MEIAVAVFDDNKDRLDSLKMLISRQDKMLCTGMFENCIDVIKKIESSLPDVVLMDIDMPGMNGIEGVRLIKQHFPKVLIIMQTVFEDDEKIFAAILAGADGYILKKTPPQKLIEGIFEVMENGAPMTASVAKQVLKLFQNQPARVDEYNLTEREKEILGYLVKGMSYKMIADACNVTYFTVNMHIKNIYEKLHVHSATEAVSKALKNKIV
jgi:DNA-binding NarL/FixJ family response regulator